MFEVFKRVGKFVKYGLQGLIATVVIGSIFFGGIRNASELICFLFLGLLLICIVEGLARATVWIISGYFESTAKNNIPSNELKKMKEYYTCYRLMEKINKKINNKNDSII